MVNPERHADIFKKIPRSLNNLGQRIFDRFAPARCTRGNAEASGYRTAAPSPAVACWIMLFYRMANTSRVSAMANLSARAALFNRQ